MNSFEILIADDHELFRRTVRSFLESQPGYHVSGEAGDGMEAVEKVRQLRPDIVLMDINMPRMDGLEATRIIRREIPECNVIIVTENHPSIAREQARSVDARDSVTKSDLIRDLLPAIEKVFRHAETDSPTESITEETTPKGRVRTGGALTRLVDEFDWATTPLGSIEQWPQSLKTIVQVMLASRFAMWMSWGPDLTFLYNDAYAKMSLGKKHPWALGKPSEKVWEEIWGDIGPRIQKVLDTGEATWDEALLLFLERSGYREETYHTFSYSPLSGDDGKIAGHLCVVTEETDRVIGERRLRTLRSLATELSKTYTEEDVVSSLSRSLSENEQDLPFTLTYLLSQDGRQARLACCTAITAGHKAAPEVIELAEKNQTWPLSDLLGGKDSVVVEDLAERFGILPTGEWDRPPNRALLLPVTSQGQSTPAGIIVVGLNPYRPLDVSYAGFLNLIAGQVAASIANARAYEGEKKRAEALAEIDRAKTAFFSNVSHEFRTPLTLMLGPVEELLARSHTDLTPAAKSQLELVNRNGSRLLRLVNNLLDFSRIEAGRMQAIYLPTDLAAFTIELASVFRSATEKAGLKLEVDCPKLPEPIYVDRGMWEKIVLNLISNAFKFTFEGKIAISLIPLDDRVELRVRDTGVGIPSHELNRLFDRFHRIENTRSRTHEGSGIGLALVQELAKLHGGSVRIESVLGEGSIFIVTVPRGKAHLPSERIGGSRTLASTAMGAAPFVEEALRWLPDPQYEEPTDELFPDEELLPIACPPDPQSGSDFDQRPLIVVADDNSDMRKYLVRLMSERYEVKAVADGQAALEYIRERRPQLVLSDVMMPNLDGFGLLRELRSDPQTRTIPIILLSARAGEESRVEGMEHGADDYLIKPFSARELLARVQTHIQMARVRKEGEDALRDTKSRLEATLAATEIATWIWDVENDRVVADQNLARFFSVSPEDAAGAPMEKYLQAVHPDDRERFNTKIQEALHAPEGQFETDYRLIRSDGSVRWVTARGKVERDAAGRPVRFPGVLLDITERKQVEERERKMTAEAIAANAKFRAVFEQTTVFAGIMTLDGTVVDANRVCSEACGYESSDVIGKLLCDTGWWRNVPESREKIIAATPLAAQGSPYREVLSYSWADGTTRLVDFALYPIRDKDDQIIFLHLTGVDITDLKRAEESYRGLAETLDVEVRARTQELEQRNTEVMHQAKLLRQFSQRLMEIQDTERRHIARELHDSAGQILTALAMTLSRVAEQAHATAPALAIDAHEGQDLVQQLSQEIRTMSYLLHPPLLDETGLSEALSWYIQGLMQRSGLEIKLDVSNNFGRLSREMELVMFRLVQEGLTNIHRHSESKTASITLARNPESVSLEISDEGKGISPEKLVELQSQGSGVGLRGMRERVLQFGGQMKIESTGVGTQISFQFPLRESNPSFPAASETLSQLAR